VAASQLSQNWPEIHDPLSLVGECKVLSAIHLDNWQKILFPCSICLHFS
jgi:hypothetical protein